MSGAVGLIVLLAVLGAFVLAGFWILILRAGLSPLREELARLTEQVRTQNEISLDDDLRVS